MNTKDNRPPPKKRLDMVLVERGLAETRTKARALIMAGGVYVDGVKTDKAGVLVGKAPGSRSGTLHSST
jgi:predicted rRNA methylase YqxC with S4 and FtsJ domains